jgi:hypothetical protein
MKLRRTLWIVLGIIAIAFTIHTIVNGLPALGTLNPHG